MASLFDETWNPQSGRSRMVLLVVEPTTVFAYWEMDEDRKRMCSQHFQTEWKNLPFFLRLYDVTDILFDGYNAHTVHQFEIHPSSDHWYVHAVQSGRRYVGDIATATWEGSFFSVLRSNVVETPADLTAQPNAGQVKFSRVWTKLETVSCDERSLAHEPTTVPQGSDSPSFPYPHELDGYRVHERG